MAKTSIGYAALIAALLAGGAAQAGDPLSSLQDRGVVKGSDQLPVLPAGAPRLQSTTASAILGFVRNYPAGIWCDGAHDDTFAIQAAIDSGVSFDLPPGVCVTSATLTLSKAASHGQVIRGAGETAADGSGQGKTTIRPTAAVTTAVKVDGAPFGGYLQGATIEGLTLDMSAMAAGSNGFQQLQAFDMRYARVRVRGDVGKTSWLFGPGAYTTSLNDIQGSLVYCLGNGVNNPTTITLVNPDINGLNVEQCASVTTIGGAIQPAYQPSNTIIFIPPGSPGLYGFGPIPSTGIYLDLGSYALNAQFFSSIGTDWESPEQPPETCPISGWAYGTYNDGINGCAPIVLTMKVDSSVKHASFTNSSFSGIYIYSPGGADMTATGFKVGEGQGNYYDGKQTFNGPVEIGNAQALTLFSDFARSKSTGVIDASTGSVSLAGGLSASTLTASGLMTAQSLGVVPNNNGNFINIVDSARHPMFGCYSGGSRETDSCFSSTIAGYQDDGGTTQTWVFNSESGTISAGSEIYPGSGTSEKPVLTSAAGLLAGNGNPSGSIGNQGDYYFRGDCIHGSMNCLWHKEPGGWFAIQ